MPCSYEEGVNVTINFVATINLAIKQKGNEKMEKAELNKKHFYKMIGNGELMSEMNDVRNELSDYVGWAYGHLSPEDLDIFGENGDLITKANALRLALDDFIAQAGKFSGATPKLATELGDGWENYVGFDDYCENHDCVNCPIRTLGMQKGKSCENCYYEDL